MFIPYTTVVLLLVITRHHAASGYGSHAMINNLKYGSSRSTHHSWNDHTYHNEEEDDDNSESMSRRRKILQLTCNLITTSSLLVTTIPTSKANANDDVQQLTTSNFISCGKVFEIKDPNTYSAVVYIPPPATVAVKRQQQRQINEKIESYPLLVVLHGAGNNEHDALYEFTLGDHRMLPLSLLSQQTASPTLLAENFIIVAPYVGKDKRSLYDEPRSKILSFIDWFQSWLETQQLTTAVVNDDDEDEDEDSATWKGKVKIDPTKISLFGFSEGSLLAVELATTCKFNAIVLASYGYTGILPPKAVDRLRGIPFWIFHSTSDDVYNISCSDRLVNSLLAGGVGEGSGTDIFDVRERIKYTRLIPPTPAKIMSREDENISIVSGREHVRTALVASASEDVYAWLLSL
jgi:predicted esterase